MNPRRRSKRLDQGCRLHARSMLHTGLSSSTVGYRQEARNGITISYRFCTQSVAFPSSTQILFLCVIEPAASNLLLRSAGDLFFLLFSACPCWSNEALQSHPWCVDRRLSSEDQSIIQEASECAADKRAYHRDPKVVVYNHHQLRQRPHQEPYLQPSTHSSHNQHST